MMLMVCKSLSRAAVRFLLGAACVVTTAAQSSPQSAGQQSNPQQTATPPSAPAGGYRISGIVVDANSGTPLTGVEVHATNLGLGPAATDTFQRSAAALTAGDGRFVFEGLAPGRYQLLARKNGYPPVSYQQHENVWTAVIVGPGLDSDNLVFQLHTGAAISGEVRDDLGDPVRGAQVMLYRQNLANGERSVQFTQQKPTNDLGRYRFGGLQPGVYFVGVSAHPWYASFGAGRMALQIRQRVISDISMGARIVVSSGDREVPAEPDPLDVAYPILFYSGATDPSRASQLTLLPGEQATADFNLYALPSVHLTVRMPPSGEQGFSLNVSAIEHTMGTHQVNVVARMMNWGNGLAEISLPPGHFQLNVAESQNGREIGRWVQDVDTSRDADLVMGSQVQRVSVSGIAKTPDNAAVPRTCVLVLRNRETGQGQSSRIAPDGAFEIPPQQVLAPGPYDVSIGGNCPAYHVDRVSSPTPGVNFSGRGFELVPGASVRLFVELGAGIGRLDGVVLRDGKPASGVMVLLVPADGPIGPTLIRSNQSSTDGSFFWTAIRPGKYTVIAADNLWNLEWARPEVLKPFLAHGELVQIVGNGQHKVTVNVQ